MFFKRLKTKTVIITVIGAALVVILILGLYFGLSATTNSESSSSSTYSTKPTEQLRAGVSGYYSHAAVSTNGYPCAKIGSDILKKNGSAVEAAIAAMFCEGVACPQSMGIGGGFLMTIYSHATKTSETLIARETAPRLATEDMFGGNSSLSQRGGLAVAVPGELRGYWEAFEKYKSGNLRWAELIEPTIKLCREGLNVTSYLAGVLNSSSDAIKASHTLGSLLLDENGDVLQAGDLLKFPKLADTLQTIADSDGVEIFYNGELGDKFVNDVKALNGIIEKQDLQDYKVKWSEPVKAVLGDLTLYTVPLPGSGVLLTFILQILDKFIPTNDSVTNYQRIVEAFKYGYGKRTELGDTDFVNITELLNNLTSLDYAADIRHEISDDRTWQDPEHYGSVLAQPEDHGTAHISLLAPNGDAVSVTSTINLLFGAKELSEQTGIILNNEMDDFSAPNITNYFEIPPSPNNYIQPGKRPLSSMCPSIVVDQNGDVQLVVGSAGGTKITTATAFVAMLNLWFHNKIDEAVSAPRIHHQLYPMALQYENDFPENLVQGLAAIGHNMSWFATGGSTVTAVAREGSQIHASSDYRRNGVTAGF